MIPLLARVFTVSLGSLALGQAVPSPKEFLGHSIGEDYFLANYTQLRSYWAELEKRSDRMIIEEIGKTSYGQPMIAAIISSPENLKNLETHRQTVFRLSRGLDREEDIARELASRGRSIVWIDGGLHATESIAGQNIIELVYRMTSRDDQELRQILDEVILLVCPANPDGLEMIANAYMATGRVGGIPVLYQRYVGHDNNRDFYTTFQSEARAIANALYRRWNPQIVYNHHQTAPRGTIIFVPPFRDPFNYNIDPLVIRGIALVGNHMTYRMSAESKPGAISRSGASYSTWWNGGLRTTPYFHNQIGILTESFGSPTPTRVAQSLNRRLPYSDYPHPLPSQEWHARQTIEYLQTANFAILSLAAKYRREFLRDHWRMARNSIERGSKPHWTVTPKLMAIAEERDRRARGAEGGGGVSDIVDAFSDPKLQDARVYVLPADQPDFTAATRFVRTLLRSGVDVDRATASFAVGDRSYPQGSFVIDAAQAFRPHIRDMFEPQWHPDDIAATGEPVRPYDSAGWTLAMQMGVEFDRHYDDLEAPVRRVAEVDVPFLPGRVTAGRAGYLLSHSETNGFLATNRLLAAGDEVYWLENASISAGTEHPAGTVFVEAGEGTEPRLRQLAAELGLEFTGVDAAPAGAAKKLSAPRIGLFDVYGGNMPTGWTQWLLEQFEFPVERVFGARVAEGDLNDEFDVLVFHTGLPASTRFQSVQRALRGGTRGGRGRGRGRGRRGGGSSDEDLDKLAEALPPFEDWSTIRERRVRLTAEHMPALKGFVEAGGVLLALGGEAQSIAGHFELPVEVGAFTEENGQRRRTRQSEFFVPASLLWMDVDQTHPLAWGMPKRIAGMFSRSQVLAPTDASMKSVVSYPATGDVLASGWAIGEEFLHNKSAVLAGKVGRGHVYLYGANVLFRAQPMASFKLVFNAILGGTAESVARIE